MFLLWDFLYLVAFIIGLPVLLYRMITMGKYRSGIAQRFGFVPGRRGDAPCLWVHGVSMGEVLAARTLIADFRERHPDWDVVLSTTTNTGMAAARKNYPDLTVFYYPIDFSGPVRRSLSRIRPTLVALMELELWPNFISIADRRGIPVLMVNVRLGTKSYRLQRFFRRIVRGVYRKVKRLTVQTEEYASRLRDVGVLDEQIVVAGSLKYDTVVTEVPDATQLRRELGLGEDEPVLVGGSTWPGEEDILLDVYGRLKTEFPKLRLAIVPRHPERFDAVASLIAERGHTCMRRSKKESSASSEAVILGDTMGELVRFYGLATLVFVGKSLAEPGGGQNLMEPAALGRAVFFGPRVENFQETRDLLLEADAAVEVASPEELYLSMRQHLADDGLRSARGEHAREVIAAARGATQRTLDIIEQTIASSGE